MATADYFLLQITFNRCPHSLWLMARLGDFWLVSLSPQRIMPILFSHLQSWANIFPYISLSHLGVVRKLRKCPYPIISPPVSSCFWEHGGISTLIMLGDKYKINADHKHRVMVMINICQGRTYHFFPTNRMSGPCVPVCPSCILTMCS